MFWVFLCCLMTVSAITPDYDQSVIGVAGLAVIRQASKVNGIVPALDNLKHEFDTAVDAIIPCPLIPEYAECGNCVRETCLTRAEGVCEEEDLVEASNTIQVYTNGQITLDAAPILPDFDASAAEASLTNYKSALNVTGRKRRSSGSEPSCDELRTNSSACAFYISQCSCTFECPLVDAALAAQQRFEDAVRDYTTFNLFELIIDFATFDEDANAFTNARATVGMAGTNFSFNVDSPVAPYRPILTGVAIANQAIAVFDNDQ